MRIRLAIPDRLITTEALEAVAEATSLANEAAIKRGEVPSLTDAIKRGVRWRPEPFLDGEHFDLAEEVARRGWGDCDDLAPWLAGELRASGQDPGAIPRVYQTGPERFHVVVQTSDGQILDPSRWAGMKRDGTASGIGASVARPFARPYGGGIAVLPHGGSWHSRVDLPWCDALGHIASTSRAKTPERALSLAMEGAVCCGEEIDSPLVDRAIECAKLLLARADEVAAQVPRLKAVVGAKFKFSRAYYDSLSPDQQRDLLTELKAIRARDPLSGQNMIDDLLGHKHGVNLSDAARAVGPLASLVPGGGLATSMLSAFAHGGGRQSAPPGSIVHPSGQVSIPLEDETPPGHDQRAFIAYHPAGQVGPVIMRF